MSADDKITLIPSFTIKEGREEEFIAEMKRAASAVRAEEAGCFAYRLYRRKENPREFIVFEQYRDRRALSEHMTHLVALFGPPGPNSGPLPEKLAEFSEKTALVSFEEVIG